MNKLKIVGIGLILSAFLVGCNRPNLNYEGQIRSLDEIEEILGDKLEVENPEYDLNVSIYEESERF